MREESHGIPRRLVPAHHAPPSRSPRDAEHERHGPPPNAGGGHYCRSLLVHVPLSSQFILSPTFTPGAVTFSSLPSPPFAIVQPLASATVHVISAARATVAMRNSTASTTVKVCKSFRTISTALDFTREEG